MKKVSSTIWVIGAVIFIVIILFGSSSFVTIQPGERGVIFRKFSTGLDKDHIFVPGFHIIAPWNDMHVYNGTLNVRRYFSFHP